MITKSILLRRKLIREGTLCGIVLLALGVSGFLLSNYVDDSESEKNSKQAENSAIHGEHDSIQHDMGTGFQVNAFYTAYIKNHNGTFTLRREAAANLMATLREKNHLTNLSITISPVSDGPSDLIVLKSGVLTKSEVHLSFGALSDNSVYDFIEALQRNLPGMIAFQKLKLSRIGDLTNSVVQDLNRHKITPLITGEIVFQWLGIRPAEDKNSADKEGR